MIYRFSILIIGESYVPITNKELQDDSIHIYSDWKKDDTFQQRGRTRRYDYGGSHLLHNSIFATTEEEREKIIGDYLHFLERNADVLKAHGATEIEIAVTIYMEKSKRFLLLTKKEMEQLLRCGNIPVRLDILCLSKKEFSKVQNDMITERNWTNERLQSKENNR